MSAEEYADMSRPELVEELERKDEQIQDLAKTVEFIQDDLDELRDLVTGELAITLARNDDVTHDDGLVGELQKLHQRVDKVERGEVDASELVSQSTGPAVEDLVPLHQNYLQATRLEPNEHDLSNNQEIAARLFPFIAQYADPRGDEMILTSSKAADVIKREIATPELEKRLDVTDPNRNTLKRAMKFAGKFGKGLFEFYPANSDQRRNSKNILVVNRDEWIEYKDVVMGEQTTQWSGSSSSSTSTVEREDVSAEMDALVGEAEGVGQHGGGD